MELPFLLHASLDICRKEKVMLGADQLPIRCRSGAVAKDGMENREIIDLITPIYGDCKD
jgi:hypothetical protein